jgi:acetyl esterase
MDLDPGIARYVQDLADAAAGTTGKEPWPVRRAALVAFARRYDNPHPAGLEVVNAKVPAGDHDVPVRIYRPRGSGLRPGTIYMHGGGWVLGNLDTHDAATAGLAEGAGTVVVSVDYRLAPEHPYPAGFDDSYAVLLHTAAHGQAWGIDAGRLLVAGDSAGANLAAALALAARDRKGPRLRGQVLIYPCLSHEGGLPSYRENAAGPVLTSAAMRDYWSIYLGATPSGSDQHAEPLTAKTLAGLPPAFITTAQYDPVRDDGEEYAERLRAAGIPAELRRARRLTHGWLRARHISTDSAHEFSAICDATRRLLA